MNFSLSIAILSCNLFLLLLFFFFLMIRRPPRSTLFPYTRSSDLDRSQADFDSPSRQVRAIDTQCVLDGGFDCRMWACGRREREQKRVEWFHGCRMTVGATGFETICCDGMLFVLLSVWFFPGSAAAQSA